MKQLDLNSAACVIALSLIVVGADSAIAESAVKPGRADYLPEMVQVPAGSFTIGSLTGQPDNQPPRRIAMQEAFAIGKYEVTFDEYDHFARETGRPLPNDAGMGRGRKPVINVSLADAQAYCDWLSERTGRRFRLPTEAEWEYAAKYSASGQYTPAKIGWGDANCRTCRYPWQSARIRKVGSYDPNPLGLHDMLGNVWEWTCSAYTMDGYQGQETLCNANLGANTFSVRGGSWKTDDSLLRVFVRYNNTALERNDDLGFRIVEVR